MLLNFPNDNNTIDSNGFKLLYGSEYDHKGTLFYDNYNKIYMVWLVYYIDTSYGYDMTIEVTNNKVSEIWIRGIS